MVLSLLLATLLQGQTAYGFVRSVGENTHIDQAVGQWQNYRFLEQLLKGEGIKSIRTSGTIYNDGGSHLAFLNKLNADLGVTSDELFTSGSTTADAAAVIAQRKGAVYIEGPNERDICCMDGSWVAHDLATTTELSAVQKANAQIALIAPSVSLADPAMLGDLDSQVQFGNAHLYFGSSASAREPETQGWGGPVYGQIYGSIAYNIAAAKRDAPTSPVVATEGGYSSAQVSESTQASYTERLTIWAYVSGVVHTWLYDLLDDAQAFGIARIDGSLKPVAYGLQGLLAILGDSKQFMGTCSLNATIYTNVAYKSALFCKSSGERDLVLWQPAQLQNPDTGAATPATPNLVMVKASMPGKSIVYSQATTYRWSSVVAPNRGNVAAMLTERPLIIAFGAGSPVIIPALPLLGSGLINGKPIVPGNAHISEIPSGAITVSSDRPGPVLPPGLGGYETNLIYM